MPVGARCKFDGRAGQTRKPYQHGYGRAGLQNLRDEAGSGYIFKNLLRDEARRVSKPYGEGPAGHQNFLPRTSLLVDKKLLNEINSIEEIKQTAQSCKEKRIDYFDVFLQNMEKKSKDLAQRINQIIEENEFNEIDLRNLKEKLEGLEGELDQPPNVSIEEESTEFIDYIHLRLPFWEGKNELNSTFQKLRFSFVDLFIDTDWDESGITIAGGCVQGNELN